MSLVTNQRIQRLFDEYGEYHRHPANKLCHYVGIPLIVFSLVGCLWQLSPLAAVVIAALAVGYQLRISFVLTLGFAAFLVVSFVLAPGLPWAALWFGFVLGWVLQFIGHFVYEKRSPAFFENVRQLLVGPLWVLGTLAGRRALGRGSPDNVPFEGSARRRF
jgi:uncharacterized membrane protein YGL010W